MKAITLICLCGKEWTADLDKHITKVTAQWDYWIRQGKVSIELQKKLKEHHNREVLLAAFKEKGYLQCMCTECQRRTTQLLIDGKDFTKDIAFTGRIQ